MIHAGEFEVTLPGGTWRNGIRLERASLRPVVTADELFVAELGASVLPAQCVTSLLQRCVTALDSEGPVSPAAIRRLTSGDREAILLHLWRISFADPLECVFDCAACGETVEVELSTEDLLLQPYPDSQAEYERRFDLGGATYSVRFRAPCAGDIEAIAPRARRDIAAAVGQLLERCIIGFEIDGAPASTAAIPIEVEEQLSCLMLEVDPQAEILLNGNCPACTQPYAVLLDPATILIHELRAGADAFYREVQALARRFHWSEADITRIPARRRRRYLELLQESGRGVARD